MKRLYAYIRVSDPKQTDGVSLQEQREIIERYAASLGGDIVEWFEETRTAAKAGRPVFNRMVKLLRSGRANGVIFHKLDRGTRNIHDWAVIDDLLESGLDIFVAHDHADLRSRGGRLAADLQVAVAADYVRNLREEALKGIHGRLKQGLLPNGVGIGYLNTGKGNPKAIDPTKGPLVKRVFELYATGAYSLRDIVGEADRLGLRNRNGRQIRMQEIQKILRNPFYAGIIRSKRFGDFVGVHVSLVSRALFDRVQEVLEGKYVRRTKRHEFLFRRFIHCKTCSRSLIASAVKGFVYYRCSTISCPTTSVREDRVAEEIQTILRDITIDENELESIERHFDAMVADASTVRAARRVSLTATLTTLNARLSRLTDLLLDEKIEPQEHAERRTALLADRQRVEQDLQEADATGSEVVSKVKRIVELARCAETLYVSGNIAQKRRLLQIVMSNCIASGRTLAFLLREPFSTFANRSSQQSCRQLYDTPLTFSGAELSSWGDDWPEGIIHLLKTVDVVEEERQTPT